jgi:hypothetical protein
MGDLSMSIGEVALWVSKPNVLQEYSQWLTMLLAGLGCALVACLVVAGVRLRRRANFNGACTCRSYMPLDEGGTRKIEMSEPHFILL